MLLFKLLILISVIKNVNLSILVELEQYLAQLERRLKKKQRAGFWLVVLHITLTVFAFLALVGVVTIEMFIYQAFDELTKKVENLALEVDNLALKVHEIGVKWH